MKHMDVGQRGKATYVILFNIWALVNWVFCFRDSLRAYGIKTNERSDTRQDRWAQGNTHPEEHAAQGTLKRALVV